MFFNYKIIFTIKNKKKRRSEKRRKDRENNGKIENYYENYDYDNSVDEEMIMIKWRW